MPDKSEIDSVAMPRHVAIIMDGNGRWARKRKMPRIMGHRAGTKTVKKIVTAATELGIRHLTLYAFSTENWKRPAMEVQGLMGLLRTYLQDELQTMLNNGIQLSCFGQADRLPQEVRALLDEIIETTTRNVQGKPALMLNLALSYGSRSEILQAAHGMAQKYARGEIGDADFTEATMAAHLYSAGQPDPDLVIRTGGESRLSNFLLWQASYAEIYITETMWPDFTRESLVEAIRSYRERERRFGRTSEQLREAE